MWQAIALTLELATLTMLVLLALGVPLAWWLAHSRSWWSEPVAALFAKSNRQPPRAG